MGKLDIHRVPTNIFSRTKRGNAKFHVDLAKVVAVLLSAGFPRKTVEKMLGVKPSTFRRWAKTNPEFALALESGKRASVQYLKASAIQAACGYDYREEDYEIAVDPETGEERIIKKKVKVRHQPPNATLISFLLSNLTRGTDEPFIGEKAEAAKLASEEREKLLNQLQACMRPSDD